MKLFGRNKDKTAIDNYRKLISRAYETPLMLLIMVFQAACMGLMAFKDGGINRFCVVMAFALPLGTWGLTYVINKLIYADKALILLTAFLASLGVITLRAVLISPAKAISQAEVLPLGCAFMLLGALLIHFLRIRGWLVWLLMVFCAALMVMPFAFTTASSAKSWIRLWGRQLQPSEFVKPALVVILAYGFTRGSRINDWFVYAFYAAGLCVILLLQKDLGAVLLYFLLTAAMFSVGTGRWKLALAALVFAAAVGAVFVSFADRIPGFSYLPEGGEPADSAGAHVHIQRRPVRGGTGIVRRPESGSGGVGLHICCSMRGIWHSIRVVGHLCVRHNTDQGLRSRHERPGTFLCAGSLWKRV